MSAIDAFNTAAAGVLFLCSGWIAMSPKCRTGLVIHIGLVMVSLGFLALCLLGLQYYAFGSGIAAANALVHMGLVVCAIGYAHRARRRRSHQRRTSDWVERK